MERAFSIWTAYSTFLFEGWSGYIRNLDDWGWPPVAIILLPVALIIAAGMLAPKWLCVILFCGVMLPLAEFVFTAILVGLSSPNGRRDH